MQSNAMGPNFEELCDEAHQHSVVELFGSVIFILLGLLPE